MLTSKHVPEERLSAFDNYLLGCDACQESCPKNKDVQPKADVESLLPEVLGRYPSIRHLINMSENEFQNGIIAHITDKMTSRPFLTHLMRNRLLRGILQKLMTTVFKGKEILPETFVHASQNLNIYKRNALVAAVNSGDSSMLEDMRALKDDAYLGPYATWAERRLQE